MKKIPRIFCLLLSLVLVFGILPLSAVWAANTADGENVPKELGQTSPDAVSEAALSKEAAPETESPPEEIEAEAMQLLAPDSDLSTFVARASYPDGYYLQRAIIWPTNGESVTYTHNGVEFKQETVVLHGVWFDGAFQVAYCIEPGRYVDSNGYNGSQMGAGDAWGKLDFAKQRSVALALLYGAPNSLSSTDTRTNLAYQLATYIIIHEIILGWRQDVHPFSLLNDTYIDIFGGGTEANPEYLYISSTWHSSVNGKYLRRADIRYAYDYISRKLANHDLLPSFASGFQNQAPTHYLEDNGDGTYGVTLTDTNGILPDYHFAEVEGLAITQSTDGSSVTITTDNPYLEDTLIQFTKTVPSPTNSAFLIWHAKNDGQELCSLRQAGEDPVPAYFKLAMPTGSITFRKATTTGNGVELGWTADLWKVEPDGTQNFVGSGTTKLDKDEPTYTFSNLLPGEYILQEAPESEKEGFSLDTTCYHVTVTAGQDTAVTVTNTQLGRGKIIKTMPDGGSTEGRIFDVYCMSDNSFVGTYTTEGNSVMTGYLLPGEYLVYERIEDDDIYYCESPNPQTITVVAGQIAEVSFSNRLKAAQIQVQKTDAIDRPLRGVTLLLEWSENGIHWWPVSFTDSEYVTKGSCTTPGITNGRLTTGLSGILTFTGLHPGVQYRLTEVATVEGYQLLEDYAYVGGIPHSTLSVSLKIVNAPVFMLPNTGANGLACLPIGMVLCAAVGIGAMLLFEKKETA